MRNTGPGGRPPISTLWHCRFAIVLVALLTNALSVHAEVRTWPDKTGKFKRDGLFERLDGDSVVLTTADGRELTIPLARLSAEDQAYARKAATTETADDSFQPVEPSPEPTPTSTAGVPQQPGEIRVVVAKGVGVTVEEAK
jgi:hypothetical protein